MEDRQHLPLRVGAEIDQQVPAGNQVHPRKRRIAQQAVRREHAKVARLLGDDEDVGRGLAKKRWRRSGDMPYSSPSG